MRKVLFLLLIFLGTFLQASTLQDHVPHAQQVGHGRLTVMMIELYDISLYAPNGQFQKDQPFALELHYLNTIAGGRIVSQTIKEIKRQGFSDQKKLDEWEEKLSHIFVDVKKGIFLMGVFTKNKDTLFYRNGKEIGSISDPLFGQLFFNIWLGEKTREPNLRKKLLSLH